MRYDFGDLVQNFELGRVGGAPNGYQLAPLEVMIIWISRLLVLKSDDLNFTLRPCLVFKKFQNSPSYQIFGHMHGALNVVLKITNCTV